MFKWLEDMFVNHVEDLRRKQKEVEPKSVPSHLVPHDRHFVKDARIKKIVRSATNNKIVMYETVEGFTYVDDAALPSADEINALNYPRP